MAKTGRPPAVTHEQALKIRSAYERGAKISALKYRFGVCGTTIRLVLKGQHSVTRGMADIHS